MKCEKNGCDYGYSGSVEFDERVNNIYGIGIDVGKMNFCVETFFYPLLFVIHTKFIGVYGQDDDDGGDEICHLDDLFPLILSIVYAATSVLTLVGVSYWSFRSLSCMCQKLIDSLHFLVLYMPDQHFIWWVQNARGGGGGNIKLLIWF